MQSYWDMTPEEQTAWLIEFTKIHQSFAESDIVVGRFHYPPLAFTPQATGDRGGFGYVADQKKIRKNFRFHQKMKKSNGGQFLTNMAQKM
jgi:hypothetical protein